MRTGRNLEHLAKQVQAVIIKTSLDANRSKPLTEPEIQQLLADRGFLNLPSVGKTRRNSSRRRAIQTILTNMNIQANGDEKRGILPCPPKDVVIRQRDKRKKGLYTYTPTPKLLTMSPEVFGKEFGCDTREYVRRRLTEQTGLTKRLRL